MSCTRPMPAGRGDGAQMRFLPRALAARATAELACGTCLDCRLTAARDWSIRCQHEAQLHQDNCFLTLTLSPQGLALLEFENIARPKYSLDKTDWQKFVRALRKSGTQLRYFHVGEYGDEKLRPHYHALIFGKDFTEGASWETDANGYPYWTSPEIKEKWPYGEHYLKRLTPETANYVCRYVQKKLTGKQSTTAIHRVNASTEERWDVNPEYCTMSRRPGIGSEWFTRFHRDLFPADHVVTNGREASVPKYYNDKLKKFDRDLWTRIKKERTVKTAKANPNEKTYARRAVKEKCTEARIGQAKKRE